MTSFGTRFSVAFRIALRELRGGLKGFYIFLACIAKDPAKRAAWDILCGPADWEEAAKFGDQRLLCEAGQTQRAASTPSAQLATHSTTLGCAQS